MELLIPVTLAFLEADFCRQLAHSVADSSTSQVRDAVAAGTRSLAVVLARIKEEVAESARAFGIYSSFQVSKYCLRVHKKATTFVVFAVQPCFYNVAVPLSHSLSSRRSTC